jgi:regulator of protease activity HflC (stomatin/prohibitin superfamily)
MFFFGIVKEWERHALFFLGRFSRMIPPGIYFYIPLLHRVLYKIDMRIISYNVPSQRGLTRDNIPVEVDAIMYYQVQDAKAGVLNVDDYHRATQMSALSALRDMVGKSNLDELLSQRDKIGNLLREHIEGLSSKWGVSVHSVEVKDVIVAKELEEAISREAEAEREKRARVKLAEAETLAADAILAAAKKYEGNLTALQIRSMNMLYEMCMEGEATMVFVPTERTLGGMPGVIGIESLAEIMKRAKKPDEPSEQKELK